MKKSVYLIFWMLAFQAVLGFFAQLFGVFYFWVVFPATMAAICFFCAHQMKFFFGSDLSFGGSPSPKKNLFGSLKYGVYKIDWVLVFVALVSVLCLWQVHYNYTGKINLATDTTLSYHDVKNMRYEYPYFSDEWYAVLLSRNAIEHNSLPLKGFGGEYFMNLEMFFHSLVAEIVLLFRIDIITQYINISIAANVLIIILSYLFLRINNIPKTASGIAALSILYITSGANLPGIWNFMPVHSGIIFFLLGMCFLALNSFWMALAAGFFIAIFYAPLMIFYILALAVFWIYKKNNRQIAVCAGFFGLLGSKIFYTSYYGSGMTPDFAPYFVAPWIFILLACFGLLPVFKKAKWLAAILLLGAAYWVFYALTSARFFIEYERTVFFTAILICIFSGFGIAWLEKKAEKFGKLIKYAEVFGLLLFLFLAPFYTQGENWKNFTVSDLRSSRQYFPKAPANKYLFYDDLEIFKNIKNKKFLSVPWKGTVVGVATGNYPAVTKEGTVSMGREAAVGQFLNFDCQGKTAMAKTMDLDYIYLYSFSCPGFEKIKESREGFVLYEFKDED